MIFYFFLKYKKYFVKAIIYQKTELNSIQCIERGGQTVFCLVNWSLYISCQNFDLSTFIAFWRRTEKYMDPHFKLSMNTIYIF